MSEQTKPHASVSSYGMSLAITTILGALFFAFKAANPDFAEWMEGTFGHSWLSQGILSLAAFWLLGLFFKKSGIGGKRLAVTVISGVVVSGLILAVAAYAGALVEAAQG